MTVAKGEIVQSLFIAVKQDTEKIYTNVDVQGRYWFRRLGVHNFETNDLEAETCSGYMDFNGTGLLDGNFTCFYTDGTSNSSNIKETYKVNADGSVNIKNGEIFHIASDNNHSCSAQRTLKWRSRP